MNSRLLFALPALALALIAVVLAIIGFMRAPAPVSSPGSGLSPVAAPAEPQPAAPPRHEYLVATVAMSPGDELDAEHFQSISSDTPIEGAIPADAVTFGQPLAAMIQAGELLRQEQMEPSSLVRSLLKPGTQAIAIPVNDVSGVGGLLKPGDEVNVYASFDRSDKNEPAALTVLRNVVVIAVKGVAYSGEGVSEDERRRNASVVLAVPDDHVAALLLASNEGDVRLAALAGAESDAQPATAQAIVDANNPDPTYLNDLFPTPPPPPRAAPSRPAGSRVQVFEGAEQRSVYVR
ncbi:Flp pilus assembly protein CpaB [Marinobacter zhejiangensis]|uniref:Pilus assembly protein CpaB n=1 Tax=Marinobacter zhejiangensis TaxID=488535 RepID=A0A1I4M964_9GAMM|nr:Flp pilus assembly protein CpaB [Marinobacter zhejiangensis]SFL99457.1 pilus assembly protein CpaB [Marinobacter zhejiangensis]